MSGDACRTPASLGLYDASIGGQHEFPTPCCPDPSAHIDCFGRYSCRGSATLVNRLGASVHFCSGEEAARIVQITDVCEDFGTVIATCPGDRTCSDLDLISLDFQSRFANRYPNCVLSAGLDPNRVLIQLAPWRVLCSDHGPSVGSPCRNDVDCRPAPAPVVGALACREGQCVEVSRPPRPMHFEESCQARVGARISNSPTCDTCVRTSAGQQFCSISCVLDEDCPADFLCAYLATECRGACLPLGQRSGLSRPVGSQPSDAGTDASVDDARSAEASPDGG